MKTYLQLLLVAIFLACPQFAMACGGPQSFQSLDVGVLVTMVALYLGAVTLAPFLLVFLVFKVVRFLWV